MSKQLCQNLKYHISSVTLGLELALLSSVRHSLGPGEALNPHLQADQPASLLRFS